jgi:hypothetical protein
MNKIIALLAVLVAPATVSAQALTPITNVNNLSTRLIGIGNIVTYILVALAVIYIVYNVVQFMIKPPGGEREGALANIGWGILGLFIIVSLWGLVNILTNTFKTTPTQQAIPNLSNVTVGGGIPANQIPLVP